MKTITATGFAIWASYLINGDDSGLEPGDKEQADAFAEYMGGDIVDCGEDSFFARPDYPPEALRGTCCEYVALIQEKPTSYQIAPRYQLAQRKADDPESKWELRAHGARYGQVELAGVVAELESKGFAVIALALPAIELGRIVTARNSGGAWSAWHELQPQAYNVGGYLTEADAIAALHRYCGRPCDRDPVLWTFKGMKGLGNAANH